MQQVFSTTLNQMLVFFLIMLVGYILRKKRVLDEGAVKLLSRLLSDVIMSAVCFNAFAENCKPEALRENALLLLCGVITLTFCFFAAAILRRFFARERYTRNIYLYSFTIANIGYMGYPIVEAVFGAEALFNMIVFCIPFNIFIYSVGIALLNPNNEKISFKSLISPVFIFMAVGAVVGLSGIPLPSAVTKTSGLLSGCMAPIAMLLAGIVIAGYSLRELFAGCSVYIAAIFRMLIIPAAGMLIAKAASLPMNFQIIILTVLAMPFGLNTVVFPAAYGGDTQTGARLALISNLMGIITIPVMYAIFL